MSDIAIDDAVTAERLESPPPGDEDAYKTVAYPIFSIVSVQMLLENYTSHPIKENPEHAYQLPPCLHKVYV